MLSRHLPKLRARAEGVTFENGCLYYGTCAAGRRVRTTIVYSYARDHAGAIPPSWDDAGMPDEERAAVFLESIGEELGPSPFIATCLQCEAAFTVVAYERQEGGPGVVALPASHGGLRTPAHIAGSQLLPRPGPTRAVRGGRQCRRRDVSKRSREPASAPHGPQPAPSSAQHCPARAAVLTKHPEGAPPSATTPIVGTRLLGFREENVTPLRTGTSGGG